MCSTIPRPSGRKRRALSLILLSPPQRRLRCVLPPSSCSSVSLPFLPSRHRSLRSLPSEHLEETSRCCGVVCCYRSDLSPGLSWCVFTVCVCVVSRLFTACVSPQMRLVRLASSHPTLWMVHLRTRPSWPCSPNWRHVYPHCLVSFHCDAFSPCVHLFSSSLALAQRVELTERTIASAFIAAFMRWVAEVCVPCVFLV